MVILKPLVMRHVVADADNKESPERKVYGSAP